MASLPAARFSAPIKYSGKFPKSFQTSRPTAATLADVKKKLPESAAALTARPEGADGPALPAWKAFVVQFSLTSGVEAKVFAGRVEHLSSGRRVRFGADDELLTILRRWLTDLEEPVPPV